MKLFVCLLISILACDFSLASPAWDGLRVTWNLNPFSDYAFTPMPRTVSETAAAGFVLKDNFCGSDTTFRGIRYWTQSDPAVILLYDINGYIAGMQTSFLKSLLPNPSPWVVGHPAISEGDYWTLTVYFVDPTIICTTGRSAADYAAQGTGDRLVIQNGTDATNAASSLTIPMTEDGVSTTSWTKGYCFWTMGLHYWYNVTKGMDCNYFYPFFLLYNNQKLNAFGFAINAPLTSPRYEHPTVTEAGQFINPVPTCFSTDSSFQKLSTMHVYMIDSPRSTTFC